MLPLIFDMQFSIALQMAKEKQAEELDRAITPLFKVISRDDVSFQAKMHEKQMAYGILLQSCGLMEMTVDVSKIQRNMKVSLLICSFSLERCLTQFHCYTTTTVRLEKKHTIFML